MKNSAKLALITLSIFAFLSCRNEGKTEGVSMNEATEIGFLNESYIHFENVFSALANNDAKKAQSELYKATETLAREGKNLTGKDRATLEMAMQSLNNMGDSLQKDKIISSADLKEAVRVAKLALDRDYLVINDPNILTKSKKTETKEIINVFSSNMKKLEETTKDLKRDDDERGKELYEEGQELQKQYSVWLSKVRAHVQKATLHLENDYIENVNALQ